MFKTISLIVKYIFVLIVYLFIFGIMRLIYLDIKSVSIRRYGTGRKYPYLKLLNQREYLDFKIEEAYTLDSDMTLGRGSDNDIILEDPFLSKKHARFILRDGKIYIEDLNSRNGTHINGKPIEKDIEVLLSDGDKLKMGNVEFLFICAAAESGKAM